MNETRIALALVALGVVLLAATFAYLAYDRPGGAASAEPDGARSAATAAPLEREQEQRTSDAGKEAGEPTTARTDPGSVRVKANGTPSSRNVAPSPEARAAPPEALAPVPAEAGVTAARGEVPAYAPLRESYADGVTEVVVQTEAMHEDEMRLVASDLASYRPGEGILLVEFREGTNGDPSAGRETGFALVYASREAALAPDLRYTEQEVDELFEEDGGIRAVSYRDLGEEDPSLKDDLERISTP